MRSLAIGFAMLCCVTNAAYSDDFEVVSKPSYEAIESNLVYGLVRYDLQFLGRNSSEKNRSAEAFLKDLIKNRFQNKKGNYLITLELIHNGKTLVTEPLVSATYDVEKFLFITTSEKSSLIVNRAGVLAENFPVTNSTNRMKLSIKAYRSDTSSVDISILKEISKLSSDAAMVAIAPGVAAIASAYKPFEGIIEKILSKHVEQSITNQSEAAFTLLDDGFGNHFRYTTQNIRMNVYFSTEPTQLKGKFSTSNGFSNNLSPRSVFSTVEAGVGAARAKVVDLIRGDTSSDSTKAVGRFLTQIMDGTPYQSADVQSKCEAYFQRLNDLVTLRDARALYWATLMTYGGAIRTNSAGMACGNSSFRGELEPLNLKLSEDWQ